MEKSNKIFFKGDDSWLRNLTSSDGSNIKFDPLLLEEDSPLSAEDQDSVDDYSDEDIVDQYDELGRTPPRQAVARNRKWSNDKKLHREHEKR